MTIHGQCMEPDSDAFDTLTVPDLSLDARIKYCSDSVEYILGYKPQEVKGRSCWQYFHPDEIPFARAIHGRGLDLDKAASFHYARLKHKNGEWIGCECVFTVVYDVLIASTAVYKAGEKSKSLLTHTETHGDTADTVLGRAIDGANIRRIFSSSPRDPRYHMLSFISDKFKQSAETHAREPRAALILNRFTRTSTIMFATNGVEQILGFKADQLVNKSFYYCIAENCLASAIKTLESAKGNDSIAYLRFTFRDPTQEHGQRQLTGLLEHVDDSDEDDSDGETGGVSINRQSDRLSVGVESADSSVNGDVPRIMTHNAHNERYESNEQTTEYHHESPQDSSNDTPDNETSGEPSRASSGNSTDMDNNAHYAIFDRPLLHEQSSNSSLSLSHDRTPPERQLIELEAVVSCTSDGLVVIMRRAKPMMPRNVTNEQPSYPNGLFASPWAERPVLPDNLQRATSIPNIAYPPSSDPTESGLMAAIRDVAVFAWSLTGINGSLIQYARGVPKGEAVPPGGLPVWDPNAPQGQNDVFNGYSGSTHRRISMSQKPIGGPTRDGDTSSEDEIIWKRQPVMPPIRNPKRRRYQDAFESDSEAQGLRSASREEQECGRRKRMYKGITASSGE